MTIFPIEKAMENKVFENEEMNKVVNDINAKIKQESKKASSCYSVKLEYPDINDKINVYEYADAISKCFTQVGYRVWWNVILGLKESVPTGFIIIVQW